MSRKLRLSCGILALATAFLVAGGGDARAEKLLRWKFKPGQTLRYVMNQEQSQKVKIGATPMTITVTMNGNMTRRSNRR